MEQDSISPLIDQFLLVGVKKEGENYAAYIKFSLPEQLSKASERVHLFCFPEGVEQLGPNNTKNHLTQTFRFVFTGENGKQQFGFCRRVRTYRNRDSMDGRADAADKLLSLQCLCILSAHSWYSFHDKLLEIVEERFMVSNTSVIEFINSILQFPFPTEDRYFSIEVTAQNNSILPSEYSFFKPDKFTNMHLKPLFDCMLVGNIICLFAALLFERRIVVYSTNLAKLTTSVHAIVSLLHPLKWHYIYIPILPNMLLDYCMAPMPFIVGVHSSAVPILRRMPTEQIVFVDLDERNGELPKEDLKLLPDTSKLRQNLEFQLIQARRADSFVDSSISECFRLWYFPIFGNYTQFIRKGSSGSFEFFKDDWIRMSNKNNQKFLEFFSKAQMFERFVAESEQTGPLHNIFEKEIIEAPPKKDILDQLSVYKAIGSEKAQILSEKAQNQFSQFSSKASSKAHQQISSLSAKASAAKNKYNDMRSNNGSVKITAPPPPAVSRTRSETFSPRSNIPMGLPQLEVAKSESFFPRMNSPMGLPQVEEAQLIDLGLETPSPPTQPKNPHLSLMDSDIPENPTMTLSLLETSLPVSPSSNNIHQNDIQEDDWMNGFVGPSTPTQSVQSSDDPFSMFF